MKYCSQKSDIPSTPHFAVLEFDSVYVPGDERSRTNPGHGYPEHYEETVKYIAFDSKKELEEWLGNKYPFKLDSNNYTVLDVSPKQVTRSVSINI